jgi:endonuclease/exonuclease/phosphatase family metal-dependent hydrolase
MQIAIGPMSTRICKQERDNVMGRWASQTMLHANGKKSTFYTVYRVCQKSAILAGPTTAAQQQWRALQATGDEAPNPHKQFLTDLTMEIQNKIADHHKIFVMGDFNTPINDREIQHLMHKCDLFNLHEPSTIHSTAPPTFKNGKHKIDHMLGSYFFLEATISVTILSWNDSLPSDHL